MELLVAHRDDPAGSNMAARLARDMEPAGDGLWRGPRYDLAVIPTPAISADWLEERYDYDGYVFLSRHAAESGRLALTCHSTGNFGPARFGGRDCEVAVPHPGLQKEYLRELHSRRGSFPGFQITIEATHHGPTALSRPSIFVEVGTTEEQWRDAALCSAVAEALDAVVGRPAPDHPAAVCFGGTHYPAKFTSELLDGPHALGTVVPRRALGSLDGPMFDHIMRRNAGATAALLDWRGLGPAKRKLLDMLSGTDLEVVRL